MSDDEQRRRAIYDELPDEVAEVLRTARLWVNHVEAGRHETAAGVLDHLRETVVDLYRWETRVLAADDAMCVQRQVDHTRRIAGTTTPHERPPLRVVPKDE